MSPAIRPHRSLFGPLVLIGLGVLILIWSHAPSIPMAAWIARYWPVLLILWGASRLVEYARSAPGQARTGLGGGEVALLICIVFFGLVFSSAWRHRQVFFEHDWGPEMGDWNPFWHAYHYNATAAQPYVAGETVVVQSNWGDVQISPSADNTIHASIDDVVHAENEQTARSIFAGSPPAIRTEGGRILVLPGDGQQSSQLESNLRLTVPAKAMVIVEVQRGDISASQRQADLTLASGHGAVTADHVKGNVQVTVHGDSVSLDQIDGNVSVQGNGGDVMLSHISGAVSLQGEYSGDLNFQDLAHGITFTSNRTELRVGALPGSIDADMSDFSIVQASDIHLNTKDKDIEVHHFEGPVEITDLHESVTLVTDQVPTHPISVSTRDGDIDLQMPAASVFSLQASARRGTINSDFGASIQDNSELSLAESHNAGPDVHLTTEDGSISIRKATGGSAPPPAPRHPPHPPHARHSAAMTAAAVE